MFQVSIMWVMTFTKIDWLEGGRKVKRTAFFWGWGKNDLGFKVEVWKFWFFFYVFVHLDILTMCAYTIEVKLRDFILLHVRCTIVRLFYALHRRDKRRCTLSALQFFSAVSLRSPGLFLWFQGFTFELNLFQELQTCVSCVLSPVPFPPPPPNLNIFPLKVLGFFLSSLVWFVFTPTIFSDTVLPSLGIVPGCCYSLIYLFTRKSSCPSIVSRWMTWEVGGGEAWGFLGLMEHLAWALHILFEVLEWFLLHTRFL